MNLTNHGGKCCGVKTIHNLNNHPHKNALSIAARGYPQDCLQQYQKPGQRYFHEAAPQETYEKRLDRYLDYLKERNPGGIVDIVIVIGGGADQSAWIPVLEARGFKEVARTVNSNSKATIAMFILVMGGA